MSFRIRFRRIGDSLQEADMLSTAASSIFEAEMVATENSTHNMFLTTDSMMTNCENLSLCGSTDDYLNFTIQPPDLSSGRAWWAIILLVFPIATVFGNTLVVLSVYKEKSLQSVTNYFIVSLAVADIMVAVLVMPFAVYNEVKMGIWELGITACDTYIAVDVTASTASIFNLAAISVDRFIAVTQPIKYAKHSQSKRVPFTIILVWGISAAIGIPIASGLNKVDGRNEQLCVLYNSDFIIYSSISSFYIPCIIMVILYYKIFKVIRERARKAAEQSKMTSMAGHRSAGTIENTAVATPLPDTTTPDGRFTELTRLPSNRSDEDGTNRGSGSQEEEEEGSGEASQQSGSAKEEVAPEVTPTDIVIANVKSLNTIEQQSPQSEDGHPPINSDSGYCAPLSVEVETRFTNTSTTHSSPKRVYQVTQPKTQFAAHAVVKNNGTTSKVEHRKVIPIPRNVTKFSFGKAARRQGSRKRKDKLAAKKEKKATKTLAIVLGVFLLCWVPFFTCNIMNAICLKFLYDWQPPVFAFTFTTWIGYINSLFNPIIYTIFNIEFRRSFQKILASSCGRHP